MMQKHEHGQGRIEFAVILLLVFSAVVVIVAIVGSTVGNVLMNAGTTPTP